VINAPLVLKYGVSLKGPSPVPFMESIPANPQWFTIRLANGANCPMLQNDRVNGPIRQGIQRWQHSVIENVLLDGNAQNQTSGDCVGLDFADFWGLEVKGCNVMYTKSHAMRVLSANAFKVKDTHAILGSSAFAGTNVWRLEDIADADIGDGCWLGGSPGSVVYLGKRAAAMHNRTWLFKLHGGLAFNSTGGHGIEVSDCDDSEGIEISGWRLDQNFRHGLFMRNSPNNRVWGNVGAMNGLGNQTPHADFRYEGSAGTEHGMGNYGSVEVAA
jgi:hypothetical protein